MNCPHGMPSPASCFDCMEDGPVAPLTPNEPERADSYPFLARHAAQCEACNLPIIVDQLIVHTTSDRYVHESCVS